MRRPWSCHIWPEIIGDWLGSHETDPDPEMAALYSIQMFEWRIYFKILFHLRCTPYDVGERRYVVCSSVCSNWHAVSGAVCSGQDAETYIYILYYLYIIYIIFIAGMQWVVQSAGARMPRHLYDDPSTWLCLLLCAALQQAAHASPLGTLKTINKY